jgi:hypothetical protein
VKKPFYLLCLLVLLGCNYVLEDEYFKVVAPPTIEDVQLSLPEVGDTIYLFTKTLLEYRIEPGAKEILRLEVFLDEEPVSTDSPEAYAFWVDARMFPTGYYPLRLEFTISGGSGSLADIAGVETQKVKKEWTIFMDKTPPEKVAFEEIYPESGTLMLRWSPYPNNNFQIYELEKYCFDSRYEKYYLCDTLTVAEQSETEIADSAFIGGKALYKIRVKGSDQYSDFSEKTYAFDIDPKLRWQWIADNDLELVWEESPFQENLRHYELGHKNSYSPVILTNTSDTVRFYSFVFGEWSLYELKSVPKSDQERNKLTFTTEIYKGDKVHSSLNTAFFDRARNRYYTLNKGSTWTPDSLVMIGAETNLIEKELGLEGISAFAVSPNGQWAYAAYYDVLLKIDLNTFSVQQTYSFTDLENKEATLKYYRGMFVNDSNHLMLELSTGNFVVDMNSFSIRHRTFDRIHMISPDGSQLYKKGALHTWNGRKYIESGPFYQPENLRRVMQYSADSLLLIYTDWFRIVDAQSGTELKRVPLKTEWNKANTVSYDPYHHLLGQYIPQDNEKEVDFEVYNLLTGESRSIRIGNTHSYSFYLMNNKLVCSKGYILSLD